MLLAMRNQRFLSTGIRVLHHRLPGIITSRCTYQSPTYRKKHRTHPLQNNNDNFFDGSCRSFSEATKQSETNPSGHVIPFPWRHEQHILPRLEMEAIRIKGDWRTRVFLNLWEKSTGIMMEIPWYRLFGREWRQDIAEPAAWAFSRGVAGLLSNIFKVPMDDIYQSDGEYEVNFVYTTPFSSREITGDGVKTVFDKKNEEQNIAISNKAVEEENNTKDGETASSIFCDEVKEMFDEKVYNHYKKFHDATHSGTTTPQEITLKFKAVDSELWRISCFPFLSRKAVEEQPSLRKEYFELLEISRKEGANAFFRSFWAFADKMLERRGTLETTIAADVIIDCSEVFAVRDLTNRKIVQGDGEQRIVRHTIRMELDVGMMVDENENSSYYQGDWRITDIDDLVDNKEWGPAK